jgi:hypothetical protein
MGLLEWATGRGTPPAMTQAEQEASQSIVVVNRWARAGQYRLHALGPMARFKLRMMLASMVGGEMLACAHDLMTLAVGTEAAKADYSKAAQAFRKYLGTGGLPDRKALQAAAGDAWRAALRRVYSVMPADMREMNLDQFIKQIKPYMDAAAPIMSAIDEERAEDIALQMLLVKPGKSAGLYVADVPVRSAEAIDALVPHDDYERIVWWALWFNLLPFTEAEANTSRSSGPTQGAGTAASARTPSAPGRATG